MPAAALSADDSRPFELVGTLAEALSHLIRTPLSVISNDLHYFAGRIPAEELERSNEKCRRIAESLSSVALLGRTPLEFRAIDLGSLLAGVLKESLIGFVPRAVIRGDHERLAVLLRIIRDLFFGPHSRARMRIAGDNAEIELIDAGCVLSSPAASLSSALRSPADKTCKAVLADAIIWAHGGSVEVTGERRACVCFALDPQARGWE
jgi:hypothetical protein